MNGIKLVLVTSFLLLLVWAFRNRRRVGLQAGGRLLAVGVAVLAVASVLHPDLTQWIAERLGVTRGTDLVLYLFIVVASTTAVFSRLRARDLEHRLREVVRVMALRDAALMNGLPGDDRLPSRDAEG
jgi:small membrane protein